jgi:hypothetical protein
MPDLTIPYGLDGDDLMVSARNVPRGAACGCRCPACERSLVAHQGASDRAWHFQHMPDAAGATSACATAYETSIHRKAKDIIMANTVIGTPVLMARYGDRVRQAIPPARVTYTPVAIEAWLGDIQRRPDVLVKTVNGMLAIEVFYRHRCPPEKIAAFAAGTVAAMEIDLSACSRDIVGDEMALAAMVLRSARRDWLFHPEKARLDAEFSAEIIEEERIRAEREAARLAAIWKAEQQRDEEREKNRQSYNAAVREVAKNKPLETEAQKTERREKARDELLAWQEKAKRQAEAATKARGLARDDANGTSQRCAICNRPYSPFGFGMPPRIPIWACGEHRNHLAGMRT